MPTKAWNKDYDKVKMACWNPWGICNERFNYCKSLNFDVLGLSELHNAHNKKAWKSKRWITSEDAGFDKEGKCTDPAAGVGILLSNRFADSVLAKGAVGARIVWVRIKGPVCPLFIICAYIPHKFRKNFPTATDVIKQLNDLLTKCKEIKANDCIILMGDLNCEIMRNIPGCSGKWFMNRRHDDGHGEAITDLMRCHDLFAVDSLFRPRKSRMFQNQRKRVCNATYLQKDPSRRPKKLDYFLVSNRWRSCVTSSDTSWGPSVHRFGKPFDHCLLHIGWRWRVKSEKRAPCKDYKAMNDSAWDTLNANIAKNLLESSVETRDTSSRAYADQRVHRMNSCITQAIQECVPNKTKADTVRRRISDETRQLYEQRAARFSSQEAKGKKVSASMRRRWGKKIKESNLADYTNWLRTITAEMEAADVRGDLKAVHRAVKVVSGTSKSCAFKAPSKAKNGEPILDQEALAEAWRLFLEGKFASTPTETERDTYEPLGPKSDEPLTEQAFVRALIKLKSGKACGPDGIPAVVFKKCEAAARELYEVLRMIWEMEYVPPELVRAAFLMLFKNKGSSDDMTKYRCIGLLPHSYKLLSLIMLERLTEECESFLSDWQAGFRTGRGCRDNILLLRVLIDVLIKKNEKACVTFIDYTAAFDSISHKSLDKSLKAAGASRKTRAIFRAIYAAAEGMARVKGLHGDTIYSLQFKVRRGVIQGDIISPIFFVLAMEQVFRMRDDSNDGINIGNYLKIGVLGYADDAALVSG